MTNSGSHMHGVMSATDLGTEGWEKPWSGPSGGQCVELKKLADGSVAVRRSTDPQGPALVYSRQEMTAFINGVRDGLADHMITD
jgi:uncharacterized protein DUF397